MRGGDTATARGLWERLLKVIPADSPAGVPVFVKNAYHSSNWASL